MSFLLHISLFWILQKVHLVFGQDIKTWNADTNFDNPRNWESNRLPCANDRIIFPADAKVITLMPKSISLSEVVLPIDGQLVFPDNATIRIASEKVDDCEGKDAWFSVRDDYWYDPANWNISSPRAFPLGVPRRNIAVPHSHRIPCPTDSVSFPPDATFKVKAQELSTAIASLKINAQEYSTEELRNLLETPTGSLLFSGNPTITITGKGCDDPTGCICGNDKAEVLPKICVHLGICKTVECYDPVTPTGFCCPVCGAYLAIEYKQNFRLNSLANLHNSYMSKSEFLNVESFVDKTHENSIQSVYVDGGIEKGAASEVAQRIHDELKQDIGAADLYNIRSVKIYKSSRWSTEVVTHAPYSHEGVSSGGVAAIVIITFILLGLTALGFYIYKRKYIPGFSFVRFDLDAGKIEMELGATPHEDLEPGTPPSQTVSARPTKGFDNPVYGTETAPTQETIPEADEESRDSVENPMFMVFEDVLPEEKRAE